jgi:predicted glycoside hydrolase/deacetylase ChbG (UPF0249 family)
MEELTAEEIEKQFDSYMELRDKVLDVLEGHNIRIILPMLTALLAETAFETGVELKEVLRLVVAAITVKYASEMPNEDEPIH